MFSSQTIGHLSPGEEHLAEEQGRAIGHQAAELVKHHQHEHEMQGVNEPTTTHMGQAVDDAREDAGNLASAAKDAGGQIMDSIKDKAGEMVDAMTGREHKDMGMDTPAATAPMANDPTPTDATSGGGMVSPGTQQAADTANATMERLQEGRDKAIQGATNPGLEAAANLSERVEDTMAPVS